MRRSSNERVLVDGTVTDANMTVTLTDGAADIDFSSATDPRNYPGCKLIVKDSVGRAIVGYVYTNGAGTVQNIVSTKGGTTRNWAAKDAAFDTTDDYTYQIIRVYNAVQVASGSVTQANNRLSTVATGAFWWAEGTDLSAYAGGQHLLALYDSSNRALLAFTGAVGTGEGVGGEIVDAWTNSSVFPYETFTPGAGTDITLVETGTAGVCFKSASPAAGGLYKSVATVTLTSGQRPSLRWGDGQGFSSPVTIFSSALSTTSGLYATTTATHNTFGLFNNAAANFAVSGFSLKQVTTPSASGFALRNASGLGGAQSVLSETSGFNRNDSSGYTYKIFFLGA